MLARQIMIIINRWLDTSLEFLRHLCSDWQQLCTTFSPERDPGLLIEAQAGASGGRSAITLRFSSGLRLLYKSRSLETDLHFQEMLTWLNEQGYQPSFRTVRVLPGEGYGWREYVEVSGGTTQAEIERFYERQGGQLALLYALHATNFQQENLIASGEHPLLLDLETLFQARAKDSIYLDASMDVLQFSVMRVGMLPMGIFSKDGQQGSGLDGDALAYQPSLVAGFKRMYTLLMTRSKDFIDGPLARFERDEIRRTFRPTHFYRQLLAESFQPDLLRDALERDRYFDQLWQAVKVQPELARLVVCERSELLIGAIPLFTTRPDTCDIFSSRADSGTDFFELPGIAIAQQTVLRLHEDDLERQHWFIEASFSSLLMEKELPLGNIQ
ncbi:hypothetical protein KDW_58910 [Dictyobacter vulcani]|uniref:Lantibiotic biosynthesis protein dehydration domain-containing protein n=1 Tax=Dictyobacter vulcani TaxID=2607529 RepID=A0A5J4L090_9CHLR|nr:DUF4135 domain-containing protein [Dictyobacter vulcani]GER91729.1 hypothetical protein KDW_58910 [Dictyobacter vulcani]